MTTHDAHDVSEAAPDADLVLRSRSGDRDAFGELWRRHYRSAIVVARSVTTSIDADDLVQEAYARIFQAIQRGGGPTGSFRAYLFTSIRNTAAGWGRASRDTALDELEALVDPGTTEDATIAALDRSLTHTAFRSLPARWQEVLWYTEVERRGPADVAPLLGMKPVAVAQLAFRAREGLREAWIQAHLNAVDAGSECQWTIEHLGAHTRGNLGARNRERLDRHLRACARCTIVASEAQEVGSRLALVLLPVTLGVSATASYLAALQRDDAASVALAAMPSGVVEGAVVAGGVTIGATGGGQGSAGAGSSGSGWTVGGLVSAGLAALGIAGTVAAASLGLLPGGASPASPGEAGTHAAPPAAEVEASPELVDARGTDEPTPTPSQSAPPSAPPSRAPLPPPAVQPTAPDAPSPFRQLTAPLALTSAERTADGAVAIGVSGEPSREVQVFALSDDPSGDGGFSAGAPLAVAIASHEPLARATLGADGTGSLAFTLTRAQAVADVTLEVRYVEDTEGIVASQRLSELWDLREKLLADPEAADPAPTPNVSASPPPEQIAAPTPEASEQPPADAPEAAPTPAPQPLRFDDRGHFCASGDPTVRLGVSGEPGTAFAITLRSWPGEEFESHAEGVIDDDGLVEVPFERRVSGVRLTATLWDGDEQVDSGRLSFLIPWCL
ncbi:sigma-70 family RNA polymerase sigma factor [Microbacterium sp. JZ31]|uniref:sigma-70 family RNA polymerase sigma factor n=1 Tax=Microbacterium sp. JZ31 TaxID=1906274 RepID=UPI001934687E|nr:sigma-70 family RNA polymerase sigma factor [Microbacterium sp. JZ31]